MIILKHTDPKYKIWDSHIPPIDKNALEQIKNISEMDIVWPYVAVMPDAHLGKGACVGTVIPTYKAIIPSSVGVDLSCGVYAVKTSLIANQMPDNLFELRCEIEKAVPHGRTNNGGSGDKGMWNNIPQHITNDTSILNLMSGFKPMVEKYPKLNRHHARCMNHLGTLGTGNHFIELCLDESDHVWVMLHSGSRGIGNAIGTQFINEAKEYISQKNIILPDNDLAYLEEYTPLFEDYIYAIEWAGKFATYNRQFMMMAVLDVLRRTIKDVFVEEMAVNCHHNYVERIFITNGVIDTINSLEAKGIFLTRKGAVKASRGTLGVILGSMGTKSYIVKGKGNFNSFDSCSHGSGRVMSRGEAKRKISLEDHESSLQGIECRKDKDVIDESPAAYKNVDLVMQSQADLVDIVYTLKQILCVKG